MTRRVLRPVFAGLVALSVASGLALAGGPGLEPKSAPASEEDSGVIAEGGLIKQGGSGAPAGGVESALNDYPTVTRADYIFGCMQVNGQSRTALERCSCSIDVIASIIPFEEYVEAETIMSLRLRGGESVQQMFHPTMKVKVDNLKRAQVEGELKCF